MPVVLGIDAAWTTKEPSGVALVRGEGAEWRCLAVAPSYGAFLGLARGEAVDWDQRSFRAESADPAALLGASALLAGSPVDIVAVDMPVATVPIESRRCADDEVSAEFGSRWCSAHTPNPERPGPLGLAFSTALVAAGYPISTKTEHHYTCRLLEVYPHPALLSLLARPRRVPYKVSKSTKYWPGCSIAERIESLLTEFNQIAQALVAFFGNIQVQMPAAASVRQLTRLKRFEDSLDALVCAWVGAEHLAGRTVALGDQTAAIWCPADVVFGR